MGCGAIMICEHVFAMGCHRYIDMLVCVGVFGRSAYYVIIGNECELSSSLLQMRPQDCQVVQVCCGTCVYATPSHVFVHYFVGIFDGIFVQ